MKYVVKYQNDGKPFWLANGAIGSGDPIRTLLIESARKWASDKSAELYRAKVNKMYFGGEDMGQVMPYEKVKGVLMLWACDIGKVCKFYFEGFNAHISFDGKFKIVIMDKYSCTSHEYETATHSPLGLFTTLQQRFFECCNMKLSQNEHKEESILRVVERVYFSLIPTTISHE